jgi:hypothetical protein
MTDDEITKLAMKLVNELNGEPHQRHASIVCRYFKELLAKGRSAVHADDDVTATMDPENIPDLPDVLDIFKQCNRILYMCDQVPERGEDFAGSVRERVESIKEYVEEHDSISPGQQQALDSMEDGVARWLR